MDTNESKKAAQIAFQEGHQEEKSAWPISLERRNGCEELALPFYEISSLPIVAPGLEI